MPGQFLLTPIPDVVGPSCAATGNPLCEVSASAEFAVDTWSPRGTDPHGCWEIPALSIYKLGFFDGEKSTRNGFQQSTFHDNLKWPII